jgi:hypothetical protein
MLATARHTKRRLEFEPVEPRQLPSTGTVHAALANSNTSAPHRPNAALFEPFAAQLKLDPSNTPTTPPDRAHGVLKLLLASSAHKMNVTLRLSEISNVSAVILQLTSTPPSRVGVSPSPQTVAILLSPGANSGPLRHAVVHGTIDASSLTGPLAGRPLSSLASKIALHAIDAVVQTSNGDSASSYPGNYPAGELRGTLFPAPTHTHAH